MKVLFVGPSLPDARSLIEDDSIEIAGPALQGDVIAAVRRGASAIGIVDGGFEYTAPVWHKEILSALSHGVAVYGAASMGALRAAECDVFGMIGIGRIFKDYQSGVIVDDADVAIVHAPAELGYASLSLALVNVRATLDGLVHSGQLPHEVRLRIEASAGEIFFKDRSWRSVLDHCQVFDREEKAGLLSLLTSNMIDQKRMDAIALVEALCAADDRRIPQPPPWILNETFLM